MYISCQLYTAKDIKFSNTVIYMKLRYRYTDSLDNSAAMLIAKRKEKKNNKQSTCFVCQL